MKINDFHLFTFSVVCFCANCTSIMICFHCIYRGRHSPHDSWRTECLSSKTKMHQEVDKVGFIIYGQYLLEQSFSFSFHLSQQHKEQRTSGSCKVYYYQFILGIESGWVCAVWRRKLNSMGKVDAIWQFADEKKLKTIRSVWHINSLCGKLSIAIQFEILNHRVPTSSFVVCQLFCCLSMENAGSRHIQLKSHYNFIISKIYLNIYSCTSASHCGCISSGIANSAYHIGRTAHGTDTKLNLQCNVNWSVFCVKIIFFYRRRFVRRRHSHSQEPTDDRIICSNMWLCNFGGLLK